ncbi:Spo0E family sporulation regulatory protein-aspartic acid phosphatase [Clostridium chromiireducens]|uniref:Spo0E family sporulation regulatory protein-aspartic acid phosphatase n=1 Tax=Clostridium chromiireducens TaxID=225345 RepID=A0A964W1R3_9CLOT|nr:aspartyl-phosphate phosphatase Spo0E family protein [Clostridium chromiireducens]MVX63741.1 Spo0E family sporulation regulatory protein-aspartic acid phosphatase [Clostridium chromiireducens]
MISKSYIQKLKKQLYVAINQGDGNLLNKKVIELSQRLDKLIVEYQLQNQKEIHSH